MTGSHYMTIISMKYDYIGDPMNWNIAQAKKMFSELIHKVPAEPQAIYNRSTLVAVVISPDDFSQLQAVKKRDAAQSLASRFEGLRTLCHDEAYTIEVPRRGNREVNLP